jgi:SAM-dependent methyltransferase
MTSTDLTKLQNLVQVVQNLTSRVEGERVSIAFLGYTDLMLNPGEWRAMVGERTDRLVNRPNWQKLTGIHGRPDVETVPTISSMLDALLERPVDLTVFDFTKYEGSEVKHDFNFPLPEDHRDRYDVVIDFGTCEHIFNLAQALVNVHAMLRLGGRVYHCGPLCWPNHGFYGYNPTLFADFYEDNGCEIENMILSAQANVGGKREIISIDHIPKYDRFRLAYVFQGDVRLLQLEYNLSVIARKVAEVEGITYPIQRKYRDSSTWI